jgi:hypothetical protein
MEQVVEYGLRKDMIFLVLFAISCGGLAWLVKYVLRTSGEREERLIAITETLAERLDIVEDIKTAVGRLESRFERLNDRKG